MTQLGNVVGHTLIEGVNWNEEMDGIVIGGLSLRERMTMIPSLLEICMRMRVAPLSVILAP